MSFISSEVMYMVTWKRYYILILYMLLIYWTTMLRTSDTDVNLILDGVYHMSYTHHYIIETIPAMMFIPGAVLSTFIYNRYSLKVGICIGAFTQALGSIINILTSVHYAYLFIGQSLCALAYPMIILCCSLVAVKWFEDSKRVLATSIAVSITYSWFIKGFGISNIVVNLEEDEQSQKVQLAVVFGIEAFVTALIALLTLFTFQSQPKVPPSAAAEMYRDDDVLGTYRQLVFNREFMLLSWSQVWYYAMIVWITSNIDTIAKMYQISDSQIINIELWNVNFGVLGSVLLGIFLHFTKLFKTAYLAIGILSFLGWFSLFFVIDQGYTSLCILFSCLGFVQCQMISICYIFSWEVAYPLKETTVLGFIRPCCIVIGEFFNLIFTIILNRNQTKHMVTIFTTIMWVFTLLGIIFTVCMKPINSPVIEYNQVGKF